MELSQELIQMMLYAIGFSVIVLIGLPIVGRLIQFLTAVILKSLFGMVNKNGKLYAFFMNRVTFPGVMLHELSHAGMAFITGAKVKSVSLYRKKNGHLGQVSYAPRGWFGFRQIQMLFTSVAPIIMGILVEPILFVIYRNQLNQWSLRISLQADKVPWLLILRILVIYLMLCVVCHMNMSKEDSVIYLRGIPFGFLLLFVIGMFLQYFQIVDFAVYLNRVKEILLRIS